VLRAGVGGRVRRRWLRGLLIVLSLTPAAGGRADPSDPRLSVPAVPYLPQSEALCGGAALAMVLRYWGTPDVRAEDFADSLTPDRRGITTEALVRAAESRGARAFALHGDAASAASHLEKGRPLIALISSASGGHHYVVLLAWANGRVLFHDPAVGPFRVMPEADWRSAWGASGNWLLLVLPPEEAAPPEPPPAAAPVEEDSCAGLVPSAVALAHAG
jgi:ABC-type bacteriocin/lantibiotic exporter with double-glycine peptidase domain